MYTNKNSMVEGGPAGVQAGKWTTGTDVGSLIPGDSLSVYSKHSTIWLQATIIAIPSVLCVVAAWAKEGCFPCLHHPPIHTWGRWKSWPWAPKSRRAVPVAHQWQHLGEEPQHLSYETQWSWLRRWRCGRTDPEYVKAGELAPPLAHSCKWWTSQGSAGEPTLVVKTGETWRAGQPCTIPTSSPSVISWSMWGRVQSCGPRVSGSPRQRAAMGCPGRVLARPQCQWCSRDQEPWPVHCLNAYM